MYCVLTHVVAYIVIGLEMKDWPLFRLMSTWRELLREGKSVITGLNARDGA